MGVVQTDARQRAFEFSNLGLAAKKAGRLKDASDFLGAALRLAPDEAGIWANLGNLQRYVGDLRGAEASYRAALKIKPNDPACLLSLSSVLLGQGRYEEGWPLHDLRSERLTTPARKHSFPEWRGEPLEGRSLLIWAEQGLGDQIQCYRFARMAKEAGASRVTVICAPPLASLFETQGADTVIPLADPMTIPRHDFWTLPFSAARYFYPTLSEVRGTPYIDIPHKGGGGVGIVWKGNPLLPNDANRSLPAFPDLPGRDLQGLAGDFLPTARLVAGLDLVITVDTSMAHLAGAMGVPCWVMLPALGCDWRWLQDRTDSPWYSSVRLFRQKAPGDWAGVIDEVRATL